jgi:cell division protein FtsB
MAEETTLDSARAHRSHRARPNHRHTRSYTVVLLYIALVALLLVVLGLSIRLGMYARDYARLNTLEQTRAAQLVEQQEEAAALRAELDAMVQERLPRLTPITLDQVIPVNDHYVRNVMFMVTRKGREERYEYTMVMDNNGLQHVYPDVKIMLFDRSGIQVGVAEVGYDRSGRPNENVLERGEIRTHSSLIQLFDESPPEYYLIRAKVP